MKSLDYAALIYVVVFLAALLFAQATARTAFKHVDRSTRMKRRLEALASELPGEDAASLLRKAAGARPDAPILDRWLQAFETLIFQAGLSIAPQRLIAITGGGAVTFWLAFAIVAGVKLGASLNVIVLSLAGAMALAGLGLFSWLRFRRSGRQKAIEEQLPRAIEIMTRGLRAGHPVLAALALAIGEVGEPMGPELARVVEATTYGSEFKEALKALAVRTGSDSVRFFSVAVGIQSETGGNLAELLESLNVIMRSRATLGSKVSALAGEGKATAWLLSAMPFGLMAFQLVVNPHFYLDKMGDPIFWPSFGVLAVLFVVGWFFMNRIINFKY